MIISAINRLIYEGRINEALNLLVKGKASIPPILFQQKHVEIITIGNKYHDINKVFTDIISSK